MLAAYAAACRACGAAECRLRDAAMLLRSQGAPIAAFELGDPAPSADANTPAELAAVEAMLRARLDGRR